MKRVPSIYKLEQQQEDYAKNEESSNAQNAAHILQLNSSLKMVIFKFVVEDHAKQQLFQPLFDVPTLNQSIVLLSNYKVAILSLITKRT